MLNIDVRLPTSPPRSAAAEIRRIDAHFRRVLSRLHQSPPPRLGPAQRRARAEHLEHLERYQRRRRFPQNRRHSAPPRASAPASRRRESPDASPFSPIKNGAWEYRDHTEGPVELLGEAAIDIPALYADLPD